MNILGSFHDQLAGRLNLTYNPTNGTISIAEQDANGTNTSSATSATGVMSLDAWQHVAMVRHGNVVTGYLNGVNVVTYTDTETRTAYPPYFRIGRLDSGAYEFPYTGNIAEIRVSSMARYVSNFTPSSLPLPDAP